MFFEITGFSQKPTALIQKDEGFRYKRMREFWHLILMILAKYCINRFFGLSDLRMTVGRSPIKRAYLHSAEKNNPVNCFSRGGGCERSERSLEVTKTKVSANVVKRTTCFCEANPRQFRVTKYLNNSA